MSRRREMLAELCALGSLAAWPLGLHAAGSTRTGAADPLDRKSLMTPRAIGAWLLGIASAGARLVAVGERGVVLLSDDAGATWRQAQAPVSTTLTAVRFVDDRHGWAVGHAGVVLNTGDGGQTWSRQLEGQAAGDLALKAAQAGPGDAAALNNAKRLAADGADKPLLDVQFADAQRGFVIGAYGLILGTVDGGAHWTSWLDRIENPKGLHFNAAAARDGQVLIAGEQGQAWSSLDGGRRFSRLALPYPGSWFAAAVLASGRWVFAGLKGKTYFSDDHGATFTAASIPIPVTLTALLTLRDGALLALNQAGQALLSTDAGASFSLLSLPPGAPLTGAVQLSDGTLIATSLRGPRRIPRIS